jgi:alanyl-tRNA synthetase
MGDKENKGTDQFAVVKAQADGLEKMMTDFKVTNDKELEQVSDSIKQVKTIKKFIEQEKDKFVAPAKAIIAEARTKYDPYIKKCEEAESQMKSVAGSFMIAKEKERVAAEKKIADKVESGYIKPETAMTKMEALPEAPKTVRTDTGSGLRMSKRKVAVITDKDLIPDEYWVIDEVRVRREALEKEKNNQPQIPGVEIREEAGLSSI